MNEKNKKIPLDKRLELNASKSEIIDAINILLEEREKVAKKEIKDFMTELEQLTAKNAMNTIFQSYYNSFLKGYYNPVPTCFQV